MRSQSSIEYPRVSRDAINLVGIFVRTTNSEEMEGKGRIAGLWDRFFREDVLTRIPGKKHPGQILAAYTDFESDENGPYSLILGAEVVEDGPVPAGMVLKTIPASDYRLVSTARGSLKAIGIEAWMKIWHDESLRKGRTYRADLEVYGEEARDPEHARFDILLGIL
jgi:predicted transcriptional regulator YdeE